MVVGRHTVEDGRVVEPLAPAPPLADAPLRAVFASITPHKLIRRELIVRHGIRFREGFVAWEDGMFLAEVGPRARRISALPDLPYYIKHREPNSLSARFPARGRARAAVETVETLRRLGADPVETDAIAAGLYRRLLRTWNGQRFLRMPQHKQQRLVSATHQAAATLAPASWDAGLSSWLQLRSLAFRTGRLSVVVALVESEQDYGRAPHVRRPALYPILARAWLGKARRKLAG